MHSNVLLLHITSSTRITAKSSTLIDNIFSNFFYSSFTSGNIVTVLSDHHAQFLVVANQASFDFEKQDHLYHDFSQIERNKAAIKNQLESIDWKGVLHLNCNDVNLSSNLFFQKIDKLINFWAPLQVQSNARKIFKSKPWITKDTLKSICNKNRLYKKMCHSKDPSKRNETETKVKNYKKHLLKLTRASKVNHYNKFFLENKLNLFKTWQGIREIINISKKGNKVINCIQNVNNMTINSPKEIAEEFNKHFTSTAKNMEKKLIKLNCDFSKFLKNPNRDSFFISPLTKEEVTSSIKTLKNSKSTGTFSIPIKFLKLLQNTLNEPIALLANLSFSTGIFPTNLTTANVIPLLKKDDHTLCSNRPISLLSNLSKIIERLIHT